MFQTKLRFCLLALILISSSVAALPDDSQQAILISSNSAIKDDKLGITIYQGDVDISQGSLNIKADKVTIYSAAEEVTRITAEGKPASFKQQPEITKGFVVAKANKIEYVISKKLITLTEDASIDQEGSSISSNVINYDLEASRIEAAGEKGKDGDTRVNVVIPAPNTNTNTNKE